MFNQNAWRGSIFHLAQHLRIHSSTTGRFLARCHPCIRTIFLIGFIALFYWTCKESTQPVAIDLSSDYMPLAVGNQWIYLDTSWSRSVGRSGFWQSIQRWEIVSKSMDSNKTIFHVQAVNIGIKIIVTWTSQDPDTLHFADTTMAEIVEIDGKIIIDARGTVLKHFMQPGDVITSPEDGSFKSSVVSGEKKSVNDMGVETLLVDFATPTPLRTNPTWVAAGIGIVSRDIETGGPSVNSGSRVRIGLQDYFVSSKE